MIWMRFLVASAVLALICTACTPAQQPPAPGPTANVLRHSARVCTDAASFVKSVRILKGDYHPEQLQDPPFSDSAALTPEQSADLRTAFELAPAYFQAELCAMDAVALDDRQCVDSEAGHSPKEPPPCYTFSWGFRNPETGKRFVAISTSLWRRGHAPSITEYSSTRLRSLLAALDAGTANFWFDTVDGHDPANSSGMTVLAALAHEVGHVRWYDWTVPTGHRIQVAARYEFARLRQCGADQLYFHDGWRAPGQPASYVIPDSAFEAPTWLPFAATETKLVHDNPPQISAFTGNRPYEATAGRQSRSPREAERELAQNLALLYAPQNSWPSLLGSLHPEHDLVETYVFGVLTYNGKQGKPRASYLGSLRLNIALPGNKISRVDIVDDYWHQRKPGLSQKVECLTSLSLADMRSTNK